MACSKDLERAGKPYPRTCDECGLGPCKHFPPPSPEGDPIQRYAAANGWTQRQQVVNDIMNDEDGYENAIHRVLERAVEIMNGG